VNPLLITDATLKERVLQALSDQYSRAILLSIIEGSKSATELSSEGDIPISTTYRRVHELQEAGLVAVERTVVTEDGKKYELYRSTIRGIKIAFGPGTVEVELVPNEDIVGKFMRMWSHMRGA